MSVWGKLAGVTAGYLVGGILGAVVGAVAGHFVLDKNDEDVAFAIALIALSAKMSKADGLWLLVVDSLEEVRKSKSKNIYQKLFLGKKFGLLHMLNLKEGLIYLI